MTRPPHSSSPSKMKCTVERRPPRGVEDRLVGLEEAEHLPLVVGRPAGVELPVANRRLEGRAEPLVQRVGRLNVVVPVDEQGGPPGTSGLSAQTTG